MNKYRSLKVTGTGVLNLKPDTTCLGVTVRGVYKEYAETLRHSAEDTTKLREALEPLGFKGDMLKTTSFNVQANYEGYNDKDGNWRQRFVGYEFFHSLKLEFPSDNDTLGRILYALANSGVTPEFGISYTVKDKEAAKDALVKNAVEDAKRKAQLLAESAGVELDEVIRIDYSFEDHVFEVRPMGGRFKACAVNDCAEEAAYGMDISPDDIRVSDNVTVVWGIK